MEVAGRKIYRVTLSGEEREALREIQRGRGAAQRRLRAHILLLADEDREGGGLTDAARIYDSDLRPVCRVIELDFKLKAFCGATADEPVPNTLTGAPS